MFNTITSMIRKICTTQITPSERLGIISRTATPHPSRTHSTIILPDGTQLPAHLALYAEYLRASEDLPTPSLNAIDTRSPSYRDIISYLIDTGHTPATAEDVQEAYLVLYDRLPGNFELETVTDQVRQFGLTEENQQS